MKSTFLNKVLLFPYYLTLKLRHLFFDRGYFKSYSFEVPIISIGNISVGGTGKTPHTEFLVRKFMERDRVAVLSRGYGRKSKGFRYVSVDDDSKMSGDEPLQIKRKFPNVIVAVDGDRVRGVERLMELPESERPTLIILDDGFQHRRLIPKKSILLISYSNPPFRDNLLPFGTLRDLPEQMKRADMVVITKCPPDVATEEQFIWRESLSLREGYPLFFTTVQYREPQPLFEEGDRRYLYSPFAILLTAIANSTDLENWVSSKYKIVGRLKYRDHKYFSKSNIRALEAKAKKGKEAVIITTEKDAQRLKEVENISPMLKERIFYFPIKVKEIGEEWENLDSLIEKELLKK